MELCLLGELHAEFVYQGWLKQVYGDQCLVCWRIHDPDPDEAALAEARPAAGGRSLSRGDHGGTPPRDGERLLLEANREPNGAAAAAAAAGKGAATAAAAAGNTAAAADRGVSVPDGCVLWVQLHCHRSHWLCGECFGDWKAACQTEAREATCPSCRSVVRSHTRAVVSGITRHVEQSERGPVPGASQPAQEA